MISRDLARRVGDLGGAGDLICVGSHDRSGLLRKTMGSVAEDIIIRGSSLPIVVVRPPLP
jgi:nucleotide-binding universal stress UspA family protein